MPFKQRDDEWLAALILGQTEPAEPSAGHLDESVLALLEFGASTPEELASVREHLAVCPTCRKLVGETIQIPSRGSWTTSRSAILVLGLAACILLVVGVFSLSPWASRSRKIAQAEAALQAGDAAKALESLRPLLMKGPQGTPESALSLARTAFSQLMNRALSRGDFDTVEALAQEAFRLGAKSPSIASLQSQAIRRMRGPLALALADRLDRFGIPLQSPLGKALPTEDPTAPRALQVLEATGTQDSIDRETYLNRAHALLISRPETARKMFASWLESHPDDVDALLGRGLAEYFEGGYAASAATFGAVRAAQPGRIAARVDEALALESSGQTAQAITRWDEILGMAIEPELRSSIENRLRILRSSGKTSPE